MNTETTIYGPRRVTKWSVDDLQPSESHWVTNAASIHTPYAGNLAITSDDNYSKWQYMPTGMWVLSRADAHALIEELCKLHNDEFDAVQRMVRLVDALIGYIEQGTFGDGDGMPLLVKSLRRACSMTLTEGEERQYEKEEDAAAVAKAEGNE